MSPRQTIAVKIGGRQIRGRGSSIIAERIDVNVPRLLDGLPVSQFQIMVAILCGAVVFMDGFDAQSIGYVAPSLIKAWNIAPPALTPAFGLGLAGLSIGALAGGPLADRFGRKPVIVISVLLFGLFSLLTVTASSVTSLVILRFATGLGLGGAMPNAIALTSEYSPSRRRATMIMVMFCGFSLGSVLGGLLAARVIPAYGWRAVFWIGGILPVSLSVLLAFVMPESIRMLSLRGTDGDRIRRILGRIDPAQRFPSTARFGTGDEQTMGRSIEQLFLAGRGMATLLLWVMFFMNLLDLYFLASWLPTVISQTGISVATAIYASLPLQLGGIVGALVLSRLLDLRRPYLVQAAVYFVAAICIAGIGMAGPSIGLLTVAIAAAGFCIVGGQIGANALAAMYYPTAIRSTGVGWALGIGRIGSIVGPTVGGVFLAWQMPTPSLFLVAAVPALIASVAALAMGLGRQGTSPLPDARLRTDTAE